MNKGLLVAKAERLAESSARAAYMAAVAESAGCKGDAMAWQSRADRLDNMAADYRAAARRTH